MPYSYRNARLTIRVYLKDAAAPLKFVNVFENLGRAKNVKRCIDDDIAAALDDGDSRISINTVEYQVEVKKKKGKPPKTEDVTVTLGQGITFPAKSYVAHTSEIEVWDRNSSKDEYGWHLPVN